MDQKERKYHDKMMTREIEIAKRGGRDINAGFSKPGYNFGLGKYIRDKGDYHKAVNEAKEIAREKGDNFQEAG